jgi:hypothetical protein
MFLHESFADLSWTWAAPEETHRQGDGLPIPAARRTAALPPIAGSNTVDPGISSAKFAALSEGAAITSKRLLG